MAKRLRIFAGPNGSGKSTIEAEVSSKYNIGHLINADNIESVLRNGHAIHFSSYGIKVTPGELRNHFMHTGFADKIDIRRLSGTLNVKNNILRLNSTDAPYSYVGAILTELIRNKSLDGNRTFSFETVMSHASKLDYINIAREKGFKTYLYFVCTESMDINVDRVRARVELGGHPVPVSKIKSRYVKSLQLLAEAVRLVDRAFIFDNSQEFETILIAEKDGGNLTIFEKAVPAWFDKYLVKKLS